MKHFDNKHGDSGGNIDNASVKEVANRYVRNCDGEKSLSVAISNIAHKWALNQHIIGLVPGQL